MKGLTSLISLNLHYTKISDAGLEHLKGLTNLQIVYLGRTQVADAGTAVSTTDCNWARRQDAEVGQTSAPNGLPKLQSVSTTSECTASWPARRGSPLRLSFAKSFFLRR